MSVGSTDSLVNTRATKIFIRPDGTDLEYIELQTKNLNPSHNVLIEPTTSAGVVAYTGALNGTLSGTLLFSEDMITDTGGYKSIATVDSSTLQLPITTWKIKTVDFASTTQIWTMLGMLENFELIGEAEGALKYDILIRLTSFNVDTDIS